MYLITGGAGFLGKNLGECIINVRQDKVRIFDLREKRDYPPEIEYIKGDITKVEEVEKVVNGCSIIYNFVSLLPCSRAGGEFLRVNVEGTRNILEAAFKNKVKKIIHVSTSVVYGVPEKIPLNENFQTKPIGDYGKSKVQAENICLEYIKKGLNISIIRPRFIIGPGRLGILTILFDWISQGKNIYTIGSGENRFQMVSVYDLIDACLLAEEKGRPGIYNIGADNIPKVKELLTALVMHAGTGARVIPTNANLIRSILIILDKLNLTPLGTEHYLIADKDYILDTSKAKKELGWVPKYGHIEMMNAAYDWYIENRNRLTSELESDFPHEKLLKILKWFS